MSSIESSRWLRLPDGSWFRWSHLGHEWERADPGVPTPAAAEHDRVSVEWTHRADGSWERIGERELSSPEPEPLLIGPAPVDATPPGSVILLKRVAASTFVAFPIVAGVYFVLWVVSALLNFLTGIMSPWLFDDPTSMLPLTWWSLGWIALAAIPVGIVVGIVKAQR